MVFLTQDDFSLLIKSDNLEAVIRSNPLVLEKAEQASIAEMQSYLAGRYDVGAVFAETGTARNPVLVMYGCDIALYHLHASFSPVKIPAIRVERYQTALDWLKMAAKGQLVLDLPTIEEGSPTSGANWGYSATKDEYLL